MLDNYPDVLTVKEFQKALSIGRTKSYNLLKSGDIDYFKLGKQIRIPKQNLVAYLNSICYNSTSQTQAHARKEQLWK